MHGLAPVGAAWSWPAAICGALLALAAGVVNAEEQLACRPLEIEPPARIDVLEGQSALAWRVITPDEATSVLFGTMHTAEPRVMAVVEHVRPAFEAATRFALEVVLDADAVTALQAAMFYQDGRDLSAVAGERLTAEAATLLADHGLPPTVVAMMKPWAVFTTLSLPGGAEGVPLDLRLMLEAQAAGKPVIGLETVAEQIAVFESIPEDEQVDLLLEAVCHYDRVQRELDEMVDRYAAHDLAGLVRLSLRYGGAHREALLDALLYARNRRMAERIEPLLNEGRAFIAVGALHLAGERGILRLLERAGYRVEALGAGQAIAPDDR